MKRNTFFGFDDRVVAAYVPFIASLVWVRLDQHAYSESCFWVTFAGLLVYLVRK